MYIDKLKQMHDLSFVVKYIASYAQYLTQVAIVENPSRGSIKK